MKISCLPVSLYQTIISGQMTVPEWAELAKVTGYDGFDISVLFIREKTPRYLKSLTDAIDRIGLPLVMITTYTDFTNPNPLQRKREMDYLRQDIALCSQLNAQYLRITAGQDHKGIIQEEAITEVIRCFHQAAQVAEEYGITLLFEDHAKPGVWDYVDFCFNPDIFLKICEGIQDTGIRINFDTGNITAAGADPRDILEKIYDKVETIHLSDMTTFGLFLPTLIGSGIVPNQEIIQILNVKGFQGWICIEEASNTGIQGIQQALSNTKKMNAAYDKTLSR